MPDALLRDAVRVTMARDLRALATEIAAYPDDESLWLVPSGITNSAGTLVLHLAGNLRHFIGAILGDSGYVRDRDAEFSRRGLSREQLQSEIRATAADVEAAFNKLDDSRLDQVFPIAIAQPPKRVRTSDWIVHLAVHLTYHLGQIDYHRRLLTAGASAVDTLSLKDIPELRS